jgi:hypothetical protein
VHHSATKAWKTKQSGQLHCGAMGKESESQVDLYKVI